MSIPQQLNFVMAVCVLVLNSQFRVLHANWTLKRLTGFIHGEIVDKLLGSLVQVLGVVATSEIMNAANRAEVEVQPGVMGFSPFPPPPADEYRSGLQDLIHERSSEFQLEFPIRTRRNRNMFFQFHMEASDEGPIRTYLLVGQRSREEENVF